MVRWCDRLYMDEKIGAKPDKWKKRVEGGKLSYSLFCIALASNERNLFDIMDCNELWFWHYRRMEVKIVGLACDKYSAVELLQEIVRDIYQETGDLKVREYFKFTR